MLSQFTRFAKRLWARLSTVTNQFFRRLTQPASSNLVTVTLADLPRRRSDLLAENALLRQRQIVRRCQIKTPHLTGHDRQSLPFLARWVPNWKPVLPIVQPETFLRLPRAGFRPCSLNIEPLVRDSADPDALSEQFIELVIRAIRP